MDPIRRGDVTEARGMRALNELKDMYPRFIVRARQSPPEMDARGIDCLVVIRLPKGMAKTEMTVPVEFKSSWLGVRKWKVVHSDPHKAGVLVFRIPSAWSRRKVRRLMYRALMRVQLNSRNGMLYQSMFQRLFRGGSRDLDRIVAMIKKKRARENSKGPHKR